MGLKVSLEETQVCKGTDGQDRCEDNQTSILSLNGEITQVIVLNKEEGLDETRDPKVYYCKITIKAEVQSAFKEDKNFEFQVKLNEMNFRNGDKLKLKFVVSEPLYLNVFQFFPYEIMSKLLNYFND